MTISGPAVKSQVKGHDEVMEPYRHCRPAATGGVGNLLLYFAAVHATKKADCVITTGL
jgi:hypothetical protein